MSASDHLQRLIRSRHVRIGLALCLLAFSGWAFVPYITYRIAPSAFVNAALLRVSAPISGRLTQDLPHKGDFIDKPITVSLITSLSPDRRHLLDLERDLAVSEEHAALARKQLQEIALADSKLEKRIDAYRDAMVKKLADQVAEVEAEANGCLAEAHQRQDVGSRMEKLVQIGSASQIRSAEVQAMQEATLTRCEMAKARSLRLQDELTSTKNGIFPSDGANDTPYSQQQRDRLLLRRQELEVAVLEGGARYAQLAEQIAEERKRLNRVDHADLALPSAHVVWSVTASPGSAVTDC